MNSVVNIEPTKNSAISLSNRQLGVLRLLSDSRGKRLSIDEVSSINQLTLGSLRRRADPLVMETPKRDGVELSRAGQRAIAAYDRADFFRQVASMHFSSYLKLDVPKDLLRRSKVKHTEPRKAVASANNDTVRDMRNTSRRAAIA